ncbi:MAG: TIGR01777 family oxidoreductase [Acidimicrobiia bacterium]
MSKNVVVSGASGLLGVALRSALSDRGDVVAALQRTPEGGGAIWNPADGELDPAVLEGCDAVVNLNGAGIGDARWSDGRKKLLRTSRIGPTALLADTIAQLDNPPAVFVSASAIGIYGDRGDEELTEASPDGDDFLASLCVEWEAAAEPAGLAGVRVVHPRTGIVLASDGGALAPLIPIFKMGIGGPIAGGRQWWSWITLRDMVDALLFMIDSDIDGPVNCVSPNPVRQRAFAEALGAQLNRPAVVPAPRFAVQARLGKELANAVAFGSQRVVPAALTAAGFAFEDPDLPAALGAVFDG